MILKCFIMVIIGIKKTFAANVKIMFLIIRVKFNKLIWRNAWQENIITRKRFGIKDLINIG
jgi:hypothetical protein